MTEQAGAIIDDGVACRFHDEHFYVTATTGGVDAVYRQMLFWTAQWRLDVDVANVNAAYAALNIAGPRPRELLPKICDEPDLSAEAFTFMGVGTRPVARVPVRPMLFGLVWAPGN